MHPKNLWNQHFVSFSSDQFAESELVFCQFQFHFYTLLMTNILIFSSIDPHTTLDMEIIVFKWILCSDIH